MSLALVIAAALILTVLKELTKNQWSDRKKLNLSELTDIHKKQVLTNREKDMYITLVAALPSYSVLAQVAFSALIDTKSQATRNRFDRKVTDFVICNRALDVIAIIELDDASHLLKKHKDADRDAMMLNAGYTTLRYPNIPSRERIRADISALTRTTNETGQQHKG